MISNETFPNFSAGFKLHVLQPVVILIRGTPSCGYSNCSRRNRMATLHDFPGPSEMGQTGMIMEL